MSSTWNEVKNLKQDLNKLIEIPFAYLVFILVIIFYFRNNTLQNFQLTNFFSYKIIDLLTNFTNLYGTLLYWLISILFVLFLLTSLLANYTPFRIKYQEYTNDYTIGYNPMAGANNCLRFLSSLGSTFWIYYIFLCQLLGLNIQTGTLDNFITFTLTILNSGALLFFIVKVIFQSKYRTSKNLMEINSDNFHYYIKLNSIEIEENEYAIFQSKYLEKTYYFFTNANTTRTVSKEWPTIDGQTQTYLENEIIPINERSYFVENRSENFEVIKYMFDYYL